MVNAQADALSVMAGRELRVTSYLDGDEGGLDHLVKTAPACR